MAIEQGTFNTMVKEAIDNLNEPIQKQVDYLIRENDIIQHELERTQIKNREILSAFGLLRNEYELRAESTPPPLKGFNTNRKITSTPNESTTMTPIVLKNIAINAKPSLSTSINFKVPNLQMNQGTYMFKRSKRVSPTSTGRKSKLKRFGNIESTDYSTSLFTDIRESISKSDMK